jgi:hypothetical protein
LSTEKRFVLQDLDILCRVLDNGKPINGIETVHLLNALHEENVKLRARNKYLAMKIQRERNIHVKEHEKWEEEIQKENEKIEQQRDFYYARLQKIIKVANGDLE